MRLKGCSGWTVWITGTICTGVSPKGRNLDQTRTWVTVPLWGGRARIWSYVRADTQSLTVCTAGIMCAWKIHSYSFSMMPAPPKCSASDLHTLEVDTYLLWFGG